MAEKSNVKVACNDDFAHEWIMNKGVKYVFVRPAFIDEDGGVPLDQLADNECVFAPGGIYVKESDESVCFANKGDSESNMEADIIVDHAMKMIDAEDEDHANIRGVVERMIAAGYTLTETCDPVGFND